MFTPNKSACVKLIAIAAMSCPALAAAQDNHFQGVTIGAQAGWDRSSIDETVLATPDDVQLTDRDDGIAYALFGGFDLQSGSFVIGGEAGFSPDGRTLRADVGADGYVKLDPKWSANVSARAGVALAPRLLAYGRVGYQLTRYRVGGYENGNSTPLASDRETGDGLIFGGGLEYAAGDSMLLRAEYRRRDLDGSLGGHQALIGVGFRF
ncbi:outer membrane immunogenic protein [Altererythrobacter atlanticus]|uniref:OmpA-like transmembrane domain protein n=1 Tax=Croceibacterium atlanticum TaxID=1267766 RepID=A0A0F7KYP4_9SPHN|nr:outer membrane beta-barrel protein [Croceibacterium atlanticum]AKH43920.1 OmpA-like transmembrane domain protein [Croceibacterium atlanticum]MBB5733630.1 outer membrane immunogenic protein [Croceibacterium atlanticum]